MFVPAAQAAGDVPGRSGYPAKLVTFDVRFEAPGAVRYDCVHAFPDGSTSIAPGCESPFAFVDLVDGPHELRVTATDATGATTQGTFAITIDTQAPPAPVIGTATVDQRTATLTGTTAAETTVAVFEGIDESRRQRWSRAIRGRSPSRTSPRARIR